MSLSMLRGLFSRRAAAPRVPQRAPANDPANDPANYRGYMEFPVVLRRRVAGADWVVAEGPLNVIMGAIACLPAEDRNAFTIGFDLPSAAADGQASQKEPA